eukprot:21231-Heterococcus_DN1.PRE.5
MMTAAAQQQQQQTAPRMTRTAVKLPARPASSVLHGPAGAAGAQILVPVIALLHYCWPRCAAQKCNTLTATIPVL